MPESITTDSRDVASILVAGELTKLTAINITAQAPDALGKAFYTIYREILAARRPPGE